MLPLLLRLFGTIFFLLILCNKLYINIYTNNSFIIYFLNIITAERYGMLWFSISLLPFVFFLLFLFSTFPFPLSLHNVQSHQRHLSLLKMMKYTKSALIHTGLFLYYNVYRWQFTFSFISILVNAVHTFCNGPKTYKQKLKIRTLSTECT